MKPWNLLQLAVASTILLEELGVSDYKRIEVSKAYNIICNL